MTRQQKDAAARQREALKRIAMYAEALADAAISEQGLTEMDEAIVNAIDLSLQDVWKQFVGASAA